MLALIGVFPKQIDRGSDLARAPGATAGGNFASFFQASVGFSGQTMLDYNGLERGRLDVSWPPKPQPGYLPIIGTFEKLEIKNRTNDRYRRRTCSRLKLACLVLLRQRRVLNALTEAIQCEAIYCISPSPFVPLEELKCEIVISEIDPETSQQKQLLLRCHAEVLRVVADRHLPGWGIACRAFDCSATLFRGTDAITASIKEA
jgi:hypothetical protein